MWHRVMKAQGWAACVVCVIWGMAMVGCAADQAHRVEVRQSVAGRSVQGVAIQSLVMGDGPDVVMIIATIHGNEAAGTPLVNRLQRHLEANPRLLTGRTLVLVPVANPDGMAAGTRHNLRGIDLNRNFPAPNRTDAASHGRPLSEPESDALHRLITQHQPRRIVSIHQPLSVIDYDGPGEALAAAMGRHTHLPVKRLGSRPGSLGSYVGLTLGRPIITYELPRSADRMSEEQLWRAYGRSLLAAVTW